MALPKADFDAEEVALHQEQVGSALDRQITARGITQASTLTSHHVSNPYDVVNRQVNMASPTAGFDAVEVALH